MQSVAKLGRSLAAALALSVIAAAPSAAGAVDGAVRAVVASGESARVIMQFATAAERDDAFNRLLDRGAAVRAVDTEAGPGLVVFGSASTFAPEIGRARHVSLDAGVRVLGAAPAPFDDAQGSPERSRGARDTSARRSNGIGRAPETIAPSRNGIAVAIVDSGIAPHADLPLSRIRAYKDFVSGGRLPVDHCGHGTHVAGIVAGNGAMSNGLYAGIAPAVDIVALRVLGNDCTGNTSDVIDALEWIARNHVAYKIKVVNISLGHGVLESIFTDPLVQAVERLSRKGIAIVTAAGNRGRNPANQDHPGYGGVGVPCNAPSAICVGSLDTQGTPQIADDRVADSSSRGPTRFDLLAKPDLVAPGVNIVSLAARGSRLFNEFPHLHVAGASGPDYFTLSGTSMASPAVAGAAALLLRDNHGLSVHALKIALQFTSRLLPQTDVLTQGAGALNITGALTLADAINANVPLGANWIRHRLTAQNQDAAGNTIPWSRRIIYGDRFVQPRFAEMHLFRWSDDLVWAYDVLAGRIDWANQSGDNIVWGNDDNIVWGNDDNIVWGNDDNIVWGNAADDNIVWGNGESDNIVWGIDDNIVWGNDDNIVWGNTADDNIVWGNGVVRDVWAAHVVAGFWAEPPAVAAAGRDALDNIVWGNGDPSTSLGANNIVWGNTVLTGGRR